ncbi:hypothetical protein ISS08_01980 [Candidatus Pacearchaeota archaeon]|nr:hypothetical protein [Candidatus Pacearchaeota archaeon]
MPILNLDDRGYRTDISRSESYTINVPDKGPIKKDSPEPYPEDRRTFDDLINLKPLKGTLDGRPCVILDTTEAYDEQGTILDHLVWIREREEWVNITFHRWLETSMEYMHGWSGPEALTNYEKQKLTEAYTDVSKVSPDKLKTLVQE